MPGQPRQQAGMLTRPDFASQVTVWVGSHLKLVANGLILRAVNVRNVDFGLALERSAQLPPVRRKPLAMTCSKISIRRIGTSM